MRPDFVPTMMGTRSSCRRVIAVLLRRPVSTDLFGEREGVVSEPVPAQVNRVIATSVRRTQVYQAHNERYPAADTGGVRHSPTI